MRMRAFMRAIVIIIRAPRRCHMPRLADVLTYARDACAYISRDARIATLLSRRLSAAARYATLLRAAQRDTPLLMPLL